MVPLIDLSRRLKRHARELHAVIDRVVSSGTVLLGEETQRLEAAVSSMAGSREAVAVASGASALQLSLAALGIGPGDEVIVPAMTAVPTAAAVCAVGATPVFADVDSRTAAIDVGAVKRAITSHTRAVIAVHLYGRPLEILDELVAMGIPIIEDCAQSHGATARVVGKVACYSFYPTKNAGGIGDGGAIATDDVSIAEMLRRIRVHGQSAQYVHTDISQNFRLSEVEAGWLSATMGTLKIDNARRAEISHRYREAAPHLVWHADHPNHVHHLAVVRVADRDAFRAHLTAAGVSSGVHYPLALTEQPAYIKFNTVPCPEAERWAAECVSLPCFPELEEHEVRQVCEALAAWK